MFYRVDYLAALLVVGGLAGVAIGWRLRRTSDERLAYGYLVVTAALVAARVAAFAFSASALAPVWSQRISGATNDLGNLALGALFGLMLSRGRRARDLAQAPDVLASLCLGLSFWTALFGVAKVLAAREMLEFFTQSGYSASFLGQVALVEVVGAMLLLIPRTVPLALFALAVDMFGAIYTHAHNGDPVHDDMDAIALLVRIGAAGCLWVMARHPAVSPRRRYGVVVALAAVSLVLAVAGGTLARHGAH